MKRVILSLVVGLLLVGVAPLSVFADTVVPDRIGNVWGSGIVDSDLATVTFPQAAINQLLIMESSGRVEIVVTRDGTVLTDRVCNGPSDGLSWCVYQWDGTVGANTTLDIDVHECTTSGCGGRRAWTWRISGLNQQGLLGVTSARSMSPDVSTSWADPNPSSIIPASWSFVDLWGAVFDIFGSDVIKYSVIAIGGLMFAVFMSDAALKWIGSVLGFKFNHGPNSTEVNAALAKAKLEAKELSVDDLREQNAIRTHEKMARDNTIGPVHYRGNYGKSDK